MSLCTTAITGTRNSLQQTGSSALSTVDLCLGHLVLYPPIMAENNSWKPDEDDDEEEVDETVSTR